MPDKPKSPDELEQMLKDMEAMSKGVSTKSAPPPTHTASGTSSGGGAFKSLLGLFIKVHDDDEVAPPAKATPAPAKTPAPPATPNYPPSMIPTKQNEPASSMANAQPARKVADLVSHEPLPQFNPPAKADAVGIDLANRSFEDIYKESGIQGGHSIDELVELFQSPTVANQPMAIKVVAVNLALMAKGTKIDDYISDAVRKDRALDAYQLMLNEHAQQIETMTKTQIERIQKEVEEYLKRKQAEMEQLRAEANEASRQSIEFAISRQVEEQRLADAISPFLEGKPNPVTIGNTPERDVTL